MLKYLHLHKLIKQYLKSKELINHIVKSNHLNKIFQKHLDNHNNKNNNLLKAMNKIFQLI